MSKFTEIIRESKFARSVLEFAIRAVILIALVMGVTYICLSNPTLTVFWYIGIFAISWGLAAKIVRAGQQGFMGAIGADAVSFKIGPRIVLLFILAFVIFIVLLMILGGMFELLGKILRFLPI